jgi:hypothetical protein
MLAAGEMYDTLDKRDLAVKRYQALLLAGNHTGPAEIARQHLRLPFQYR